MTSWPVLYKHNLDFKVGTYETENTNEKDGQTTIRHRLSGENLVSSLVRGGQAQFAVELAAPHSAFRVIEMASSLHSTFATQEVNWDPSKISYPLFLRPMVVFATEGATTLKLDSDKDGVHEIWHDVRVEISSGAILAHENYFRPASGLSIVRLAVDENGILSEGGMRVETSEIDGFVFRVVLHKQLFEDLQSPGGEINHRDSILTGALVAGLSKLQKDYAISDSGDSLWTEHQNLRVLHKLIGDLKLAAWDQDGFDSAEVATALKPFVYRPGYENT